MSVWSQQLMRAAARHDVSGAEALAFTGDGIQATRKIISDQVIRAG